MAPGFNTAGLRRSTSVVSATVDRTVYGRVAKAISVVTWPRKPRSRNPLPPKPPPCASAVPAPINGARTIGRPAKLPTPKKMSALLEYVAARVGLESNRRVKRNCEQYKLLRNRIY